MRHFQLNKLVRDGILDYMLEHGQDPEHRILDKDEILEALKDKILEEAKEIDLKSPDALEELADVLEALEYLAKELGADFETLRAAQMKKHKRMKGFEKRIYIGMLHLKDSDPWVNYYAKEPKRFPEAKV